MRSPGRQVTARDVARAAGVSQTTVSYVINKTPNQKISKETHERVMAAVERMGYAPSAAARALRRGSSDLVLLVLPDVPLGPKIADLIESISDELEPHGLTTITRRVRAASPVSALWRELRPVAVVGIDAFDRLDETEMQAAGIQVISALLSPSAGRAMTSVPQTLLGRMQVEHLAVTGHRHLGYAAPDDVRVREFFRLRLDGVRLECLELGLAEPDIVAVPLEVTAAANAILYWRAKDPRVTGVCAYNDETAFALLAGMRILGLEAPTDLAVIGVDNIPLAPFASPPLTTVDQNVHLVAVHMVHTITAALGGAPPPPPLRSDSITLVLRESA